jgi:hypothetical protein
MAISTICSFPIGSVRKDYTSGEWLDYKDNWATFNKVWVYNYTVSTINGTNSNNSKLYWQFTSNREKMMYSKGQTAHVEYYPTEAANGQFNTITN